MFKLGIVTVLYNSEDMLEDFFSSLGIQDFKDFNLYLIDNSFQNRTYEKIKNLADIYKLEHYKHVDTGGNIGVAAGNNRGIRLALEDQCEYILLCNNDIRFEQTDLIRSLISKAEEYGIVTPKIYYANSGLIWMAGGYMEHRKAMGVHYGMGTKDTLQYNKAKWVTYAPTCFLLLKRDIISKVGWMDERYFAYYDDTDFVFRALKMGYRIWYEPAFHIYHKVSSSSGGDNSLFYIYYGNRNKLIFIRKHYKGLHKLYLIAYYFFTRFFFYFLRFNNVRKKKLVQATYDGLRLRLNQTFETSDGFIGDY